MGNGNAAQLVIKNETLFQRLTRTKPPEADLAEEPLELHQGSDAGSRLLEQVALERSMGVFSLTMMGVGATVGTGIFFTMVEAVPKAGPAVILSFLIAALTAGLTAFCYAELAARVPSSGSSYSFAYATVGEFAAFIVAACLMLEYALAGSATAIGWSGYLNHFLTHSVGWQIPEALRTPMVIMNSEGLTEYHFGQFNLPPVILVCMCCFLLLKGTRESSTTNAVMVIIKLSILAFFVVIAFSGFNAQHFTPFFNLDNSKGFAGMAGVTAAAGTVFFSFIGLDTCATGGAEVKNPKRNVPLAIFSALIIVTVFYLLVSISAVGAQEANVFEGQEAGLAVILQNVTGKEWPGLLLSLGAVISVFSVTLLCIYGQTRILFAISKDGLIPASFHKVNPLTKTPVSNTIAVCCGVALVSGLIDSGFLWDMVSMGTLTAFIVVSIAVPVLRTNGDNTDHQGFRVPFGPYVIPFMSIACCLYIMKDLSPATYRTFFIWMSLAVICYFLYGMRNSRLNDRR